MAPPPKNTSKSRRRKKRRTEDFSSDSDLDSSSSSGAESVANGEESATNKSIPDESVSKPVTIDGMDIDSDVEAPQAEVLAPEVKKQLRSIKFTTTNNQTLAEAKETVKQDRQQLEQQFLAYMAGNFANDLDELRQKPDFTEKSIVMLAKTLQSGSNMFDSETLDALVKE